MKSALTDGGPGVAAYAARPRAPARSSSAISTASTYGRIRSPEVDQE